MGRTYPAAREVVRARPTPPAPDTRPARLSNLKLPKKARGKLTFTLNERATVTFAFIGAKGTRKATLKVAGKAGKNSVRLPRRPKQGRYALVVSVRDLAGNVTAPAIKTIKLRKA